MKKQIKAILIVLLFVVLMDPIKVSAFSYDTGPLYKGIYVEIEKCDASDDYYIDIVVLKIETDEYVTQSGAGYPYPSSISSNEYGDYTNEWISLSKFYDPGPTAREECSVNFFGDIEDLSVVPYSEYKVVIYDNNELIIESVVYDVEDISYGSILGLMIVFNPDDNEMYVQNMYSDEMDYQPMTITGLILILLIPVLVLGGIVFIFGEPFIYFTIPRLREQVWWVLLYNSILIVIVATAFFVVRKVGNVEPKFVFLIATIGLSFVVMLVKVKHLKQMAFQAMVPTKIVSYGYLAMWAIYFLLVSLV